MDYESAGMKKSGHCREVADSGGLTVFNLHSVYHSSFILPPFSLSFFVFFLGVGRGRSSQLIWDTRGSGRKILMKRGHLYYRRYPSNPTSLSPP